MNVTEMTLLQVLELVGVNAGNVRSKAGEVRAQAEGWIDSARAPENIKTFVRSFLRVSTDVDIPVKDLLIMVGAVAYVLMPIDFSPDIIPGLGWLDDAAVIRFALGALKRQIDKSRT